MKAHTSSRSFPSLLNDLADRTASDARLCPAYTPTAPEPSFFCDPYSIHSKSTSFIESNVTTLIINHLDQNTSLELSRSSLRMAAAFDGTHPPPAYPYTRAYSAFSALVQLQLRSGQLPTACILYARWMSPSMSCRRCGFIRETTHHIFVDCPAFRHMRKEATKAMLAEVRRTIMPMQADIWDAIVHASELIFCDGEMDGTWSLGHTRYYLGRVPDVFRIAHAGDAANGSDLRCLLIRVDSAWHLAGIRLAGRIWGDMCRSTRRIDAQ